MSPKKHTSVEIKRVSEAQREKQQKDMQKEVKRILYRKTESTKIEKRLLYKTHTEREREREIKMVPHRICEA